MLETERLKLRKFEEGDYQAVYDFGSNDEVNKYTGEKGMTSIDEANDVIKNVWFEDYKKHGYGRLAAVYKPENKVIGFAGLKYLPEIDKTDIGFRFLPEYWGKGLATEASKAIIEYGFNELGLTEIIAIAMQKNIGSNKVLLKSGMELYKVGEYLGDGGSHNWYKIEKE